MRFLPYDLVMTSLNVIRHWSAQCWSGKIHVAGNFSLRDSGESQINTPLQSRVSVFFVSDIHFCASDSSVVNNWVMFCKIICLVIAAFIPNNCEVFLFLLVSKPMQVHVPCFGFFHLHVFVDISFSC